MIGQARHIVRGLMTKWVNAAHDEDHARRYEIARRFRPNLTTSLDYANGLFKIAEGERSIFVARQSRLHFSLYGIETRLKTLRQEYLLTNGLLRPGDLVIDCGANIGEFSMICAADGAEVIAFEPDPREFAALQRNAEGHSILPIRRALWKEDGETTFYDSNDDGDSSLIDPGTAQASFSVQTSRLDNIAELPSRPIRLMKLEAEGAEPEILDGASETLKRVEYITADMGAERGIKKANTVVEVTNVLYAYGFKMLDFFPPRCTALFGKDSN